MSAFQETPSILGQSVPHRWINYIHSPLQYRIKVIQKLQPPTNVKGCKSFCGVVNYLSIFCRDLQKLLKPIYELTRKGRPFVWQEEQQVAFGTIKERMMNPPIYPNQEEDLFYIVIPPELPQAVLYGKSKMDSLD